MSTAPRTIAWRPMPQAPAKPRCCASVGVSTRSESGCSELRFKMCGAPATHTLVWRAAGYAWPTWLCEEHAGKHAGSVDLREGAGWWTEYA